MNTKGFWRTLETASVSLFFLHGLRVIFSVMFGIIYDQVFTGPIDSGLFTSNLLVLIVFLAPALTPRHPGRWFSVLMAAVVALSRVSLTLNNAQIRFWGALFVLGAGGLYLAARLGSYRRSTLFGLLVSLVADQFFRIIGQTHDLTLQSHWLPFQIVWSFLLLYATRKSQWGDKGEQYPMGSPGFVWGLGIGGFLFLETSLLFMPNGISVWTGTNYALNAISLLGMTTLALVPVFSLKIFPHLFRRRWIRVVAMVLILFSLVNGYFRTGNFSSLALLGTQGLILAGWIHLLQPSPRSNKKAGMWIAVGLVFNLILNFFNAFSFTYPYTLRFMRGQGWMVYLAAATLFGLAVILQPPGLFKSKVELPRSDRLAILAVIPVFISLIYVWPRPVKSLPTTGGLRVATYNIHYGYDEPWHYTLGEMAHLIEQEGVNIIMLQEVDRGRMTSYGVDNAYYLARHLRMNVVYLPTLEHLTGIALLHHGMTIDEELQLLTSLQEQTGIIRATLDIHGQPLNAFGIWTGLANEDTERQMEEALAFIGDRSPAVFGGDFNAEPDSPIILAVQGAGFEDPFLALGIDPPPLTAPAIHPTKRIDYVWHRGVSPNQAWVPTSLASDHRLVISEVLLP